MILFMDIFHANTKKGPASFTVNEKTLQTKYANLYMKMFGKSIDFILFYHLLSFISVKYISNNILLLAGIIHWLLSVIRNKDGMLSLLHHHFQLMIR